MGENTRAASLAFSRAEIAVMFETVDVLVHAIHPIPVGQAGHGRLQRHRPRIVTGYQLVGEGPAVAVYEEGRSGSLTASANAIMALFFPAGQDLLAQRPTILVRRDVGHVGHGERVQIVAFAGGDDLPAGNGRAMAFHSPCRSD